PENHNSQQEQRTTNNSCFRGKINLQPTTCNLQPATCNQKTTTTHNSQQEQRTTNNSCFRGKITHPTSVNKHPPSQQTPKTFIPPTSSIPSNSPFTFL